MRIIRAELKQSAKRQMRLAQPHACVISLIYYILTLVIALLVTRIGQDGLQQLRDLLNNAGLVRASAYLHRDSRASLLTSALNFVSSYLHVGFSIYAVRAARRQNAGFGTLFDGFVRFFRTFLLLLLINIFVFLWTLLFIIPGFIAAYRYSLAIYVMADHPEYTALDCIRASAQLTRGYKWQLFVLDLSFLGWILLSLIPFVSVYTLPYTEITRANFYLALLDLPENARLRPRRYKD